MHSYDAVTEMRSTVDNELFKRVINNKKHVLHGLLPLVSAASQNYNLQATLLCVLLAVTLKMQD